MIKPVPSLNNMLKVYQESMNELISFRIVLPCGLCKTNILEIILRTEYVALFIVWQQKRIINSFYRGFGITLDVIAICDLFLYEIAKKGAKMPLKMQK